MSLAIFCPAMDFNQVQILLLSSLNGVIHNDIQASIVSKKV